MSIKNVTVVCDWPLCGNTINFVPGPGCLGDQCWQAQDQINGPHLCSGHRFKTWAELEARMRGDFSEEPSVTVYAALNYNREHETEFVGVASSQDGARSLLENHRKGPLQVTEDGIVYNFPAIGPPDIVAAIVECKVKDDGR